MVTLARVTLLLLTIITTIVSVEEHPIWAGLPSHTIYAEQIHGTSKVHQAIAGSALAAGVQRSEWHKSIADILIGKHRESYQRFLVNLGQWGFRLNDFSTLFADGYSYAILQDPADLFEGECVPWYGVGWFRLRGNLDQRLLQAWYRCLNEGFIDGQMMSPLAGQDPQLHEAIVHSRIHILWYELDDGFAWSISDRSIVDRVRNEFLDLCGGVGDGTFWQRLPQSCQTFPTQGTTLWQVFTQLAEVAAAFPDQAITDQGSLHTLFDSIGLNRIPPASLRLAADAQTLYFTGRAQQFVANPSPLFSYLTTTNQTLPWPQWIPAAAMDASVVRLDFIALYQSVKVGLERWFGRQQARNYVAMANNSFVGMAGVEIEAFLQGFSGVCYAMNFPLPKDAAPQLGPMNSTIVALTLQDSTAFKTFWSRLGPIMGMLQARFTQAHGFTGYEIVIPDQGQIFIFFGHDVFLYGFGASAEILLSHIAGQGAGPAFTQQAMWQQVQTLQPLKDGVAYAAGNYGKNIAHLALMVQSMLQQMTADVTADPLLDQLAEFCLEVLPSIVHFANCFGVYGSHIHISEAQTYMLESKIALPPAPDNADKEAIP